MDHASNPGEATPQMLYGIYKPRAAAAANPFVLRDVQSANQMLDFRTTVGGGGGAASDTANAANNERIAERESLLKQRAIMTSVPAAPPVMSGSGRDQRRGDSPPRQHFRIITPGGRIGVPTAASVSQRSSAHAHAHYAAVPTTNSTTYATPTSPHSTAMSKGKSATPSGCRTGLQLTLNSLDMSRR